MSDPSEPDVRPPASEAEPQPGRSARYRRGRRAASWGALGCAVLVVLLAAVLAWMVLSRAGARFVFARLSDLLPGTFETGAVEGPVRGPLVVHDLRYETDRFVVTIQEARLEWHLGSLRRRLIDVEKLTARGVRIRILPSTVAAKRELHDINLRHNLALRSLQVDDIQIERPGGGRPIVIHRLTMRTGAWRDRLRIEDVNVVSPDVDLDARGWLQPRGDYPLDVKVVWAYRPPEERETLAGRGRLFGTLRAMRLEQRLEKPFAATVKGVLHEALFDPTFSGAIDFTGLQPRWYAPASPVTRASGHVVLENATVARSRAIGRGRLAVEGWGEVDVTDAALLRDADRWHFDRLTVKRPGQAGHLTWVGDIVFPAGKPARFAGDARWRQMTWPIDAADPAVRSASGSAQVEGTTDDYNLVVDGIFAFPNVPAGRWQGTASGNRRGLVADSVEARVFGGRLAGSARVSWKPSVAWSAQATAYGIDPHATWDVVPAALSGGTWKIRGHGDAERMTVESFRIDNPRGSLTATGALAWPDRGFTWSADATTHGISPAVLFPELPASFGGGDWHVVGRGTDQRAELSTVEGAFLGGSVTAAGTVAWEPAVAWQLQGTARQLDPAVAFPGWTGSLSGAFRTHGETVRGDVTGEVAFEDVAGTLRDRPLAAHGTVLLAGGTVSLAGVEGTWGPGRMALAGEISPQLGLGFELQRLDLAALAPGAAGIMTARGTLRGSPDAPAIEATLNGERVGWGEYVAATVSGHMAVDLAPGGKVDVDMRGSGLQLGLRRLDTLTVTMRGTREAHTLTAHMRGERDSLEVAAAGGFPSPPTAPRATAAPLVWSGTLTKLTAEGEELGRWELAAPVPVVAGAEQLRLQKLCWASGDARLCADLDWRGPASGREEKLAVNGSGHGVPLALLERLLPSDLHLHGTVDGEIHLQTAPGRVLVGQAVLRPSPGTALWSTAQGDQARLEVEGGELRLSADAGGVTVRGALALAQGGSVRGSVTLAGYRLGRPAASQPMLGHLTAELSDLRFVQSLVPVLGTTGGQASADLALSGTLAASAVGGRLHLTGGSASVPQLGLQLTDVEVTASGDGGGPLNVTGTLRSGEGTLTITGTTPLLPRRGLPMRLHLAGEQVELADLDEARIVANPEVDLVYDGALLRVAGAVTVRQARINYQGAKEGAVQPSRDVVFVGTEVPAAVDTGLEISARVRIRLGNDVTLSAVGLETKLRGALLVIEEPGQGTRASGQLELSEGTFKAYGQDLVIERGRLNYAGGPIYDPGIDVRAYRKIPEDDVTAGINARGTLRQPEVTVWAQPAMSESEALSYLLLGRPLQATQAQEGSMLANAATSLGIRGGNLLAKKLGASLGLQEASIVPGQTLEQAAFVVGKYLSPRLYVSYGIGIFDASSTLRIRYLVSEHLHAEAQTGARTSGDVLYTFEHGSPSRKELRERYRQRALPRIEPEELSTPPKVPVGAQGEEPPKTGAAAEAGKEAERATRRTEERKEPPPAPTPTPTPHR